MTHDTLVLGLMALGVRDFTVRGNQIELAAAETLTARLEDIHAVGLQAQAAQTVETRAREIDHALLDELAAFVATMPEAPETLRELVETRTRIRGD